MADIDMECVSTDIHYRLIDSLHRVSLAPIYQVNFPIVAVSIENRCDETASDRLVPRECFYISGICVIAIVNPHLYSIVKPGSFGYPVIDTVTPDFIHGVSVRCPVQT